MRKRLFGLAVVITVLALVVASPGGRALADSTAKTLSTNFTLVNFGGATANVTVAYTKTDGSAWAADPGNTSFTIPANGGQKPVYQYFDQTLSAGAGSAVVSSDQPLGAVVQILARGQQPTSGAYSAVEPSSKFYAPLVLKGQPTASGVANTQMAIQNAGTGDLSGVTVQFVNSAGAAVYTFPVPTIKAGASYYYDTSNDAALAAPFAGSAVINAGTGLISAVVNVFFGSDGLQTYVPTPASRLATSWAIPLFNARLANGLSTVVSVQNLSGSTMTAASITLSCKAFTGGNANGQATLTVHPNVDLANNQSFSFNPVVNTTDYPTGWYGSCSLVTGGSTAAIIQMRFIGTENTAAYEAIRTTETNKTFFTPLVQKRLGNGFATNTTVTNLSGSADAHVTVTYTPSPDYVAAGGAATVYTFPETIPAGSSLQQNHRLASFSPTTGGAGAAMPEGWFGTLRVVSSDQPISGFTQITNVNSPPGDTFMTYTAFTQP